MIDPGTIWASAPSSTAFTKLVIGELQSFFGDPNRVTELPPEVIPMRLWNADDTLSAIYITAGQDTDMANCSRETAIFVSSHEQADQPESITPRLLKISYDGQAMNPNTLTLMQGGTALRIKARTKTECEQIRDEILWLFRRQRDALSYQWLLETMLVKQTTEAAMPERAAFYMSTILFSWVRRHNTTATWE